jgi:defect in organelle trafficking protein DotD
MMKFKFILLLFPCFLLAACSQDKPKFVDLNLKYITTQSAPEQSVDRNAQAELAETAQSVNQSLQELSSIQLATHPGVKMPKPLNPNLIGMAQQTSLDWTGPVGPLLKKIAQASGYHVRVLGIQPAIPVIVSINAYDEPLANILRDTTYQVVKKARIKLYPQNRVIELRYLPS